MKSEINKEQNKQNMPVIKKNLNANQELEILQDLIKDEKSDMNKDKIIKQDPIKNNEVNIENDLKTKQKPDLLPKLRNLPSLKIKVPNHVNPNHQNKTNDDLKKENILNKDQSINLNKDMNPKIPSPEKTTISIKNNLNDLESLLDDSTEEEKLINIGSNSKNNSIIRPIKKKKKNANFLNIKEALSQSSNYLSDDQDSNGIIFLNDEESMNDNSLDSDKFNKKNISVNKNLKIAEPSIVDIFKPKDRNFKGIINIDSLHSDDLDIKSEMSNEDSDNQHSLKSADMKRLERNDKYDEDEKQEKSTNFANQSKAYYQSNADISNIKDPKLDFSKYSTNPNNIYDPDYVVHLTKYLNLRNDYNQDYEFYPNDKLNLENDWDYNDNVILLNKNKKNNMQKKIKVPDHIKFLAKLRANNQNFVPSPARTQTPENLDNSRLPISNRILVSAGYSAIKGLANDKDIFKNE